MDGGGGGGFRPNKPYALNRLVSRAHDGSGEGALVHGLKLENYLRAPMVRVEGQASGVGSFS